MKFREVNKKDIIETVIKILLLVGVEIGGAILFMPNYWPVWLIVVIASLYLLIRWHVNNFGYECGYCKNKFVTSFWKNALGLNLFNKKYLKCPKCHKWSSCKIFVCVKIEP